LLKNEDLGKDFDSVTLLLRKLELIELEMGLINQKIIQVTQFGNTLLLNEKDKQLISNVNTLWNQLTTLSQSRKDKLNQSLCYHDYLQRTRSFETLTEQIITTKKLLNLKQDQQQQSLKQSLNDLDNHKQLKQEIELKLNQKQYQNLVQEMKMTLLNSPSEQQQQIFSMEIENLIKIVIKQQEKLKSAMETKEKNLEENVNRMEFQNLITNFEQISNEINAVLNMSNNKNNDNNDDNGESSLGLINKTEKLISSHGEDLLKSLQLKAEEIENFQLLLQKNEEEEKKKEEIEEKLKKIKERYGNKKKYLNDQKEYLNWLLTTQETENYIQEKTLP